MVFGFMFGSVFGFEEALEPVYEALGMSGKPISNWPGAPTTVLDTAAINPILVCAIFIGVALVLAAMVLHIIAALHKGQWGEAIFSNNGLVGILVYCGGVSFVSDFMSGPHFLPSGVALCPDRRRFGTAVLQGDPDRPCGSSSQLEARKLGGLLHAEHL